LLSESERILLYACDAFGTEVAGRGEWKRLRKRLLAFTYLGESAAHPFDPIRVKKQISIQLTSSYPNAKKGREKNGYEVNFSILKKWEI